MKTKLQIKSIFGNLLFEYECETVRELVIQAVRSGANLYGANLYGADLYGANLSRASLSRADLYGANLYGADLSGANLSGANLYGADLSGANLFGADLSRASLYGANLSRASLSRADLSGANLSGADLYGADLSGANLSGANLSGAKDADLVIARTRILPEGDLIGYKKCVDGVIVKLLIPKEAKRSSAFGRKCRAEYAKVLEVFGAEFALSSWGDDGRFEYRVGETVKPVKPFDENWQEECASGIHFYITRLEAENHN